MTDRPVIFVEGGHSPYDKGASSTKSGRYVCERDEVWELAERVGEILREQYGVKVYRDAWEDTWFKPVDRANALPRCDFYLSIHANAGGGDGAEAWVYSEDNKYLGEPFRKQMKRIGQQYRGTKVEPEFVVLRDTKMKALLFEVYFVDSKDALDWTTEKGRQEMAEAIAAAAAEILGAKRKPSKRPSSGGSKPPRKPTMVSLKLPDVRLGDKSPAARRAMMLLRDRGYLPKDYNCAPGAVFGKAAVAAVKAFQKKNGLTVDGWIGAKTWFQLIAD